MFKINPYRPGAGLPKIYKMLSDEKSYSERLFLYKEIDSLNYEQSINAIDRIISLTDGYPFFIQQLCQVVYQNTDTSIIDIRNIEDNITEFYQLLDVGFFKVRYERCADSDKKFVFAMVRRSLNNQ